MQISFSTALPVTRESIDDVRAFADRLEQILNGNVAEPPAKRTAKKRSAKKSTKSKPVQEELPLEDPAPSNDELLKAASALLLGGGDVAAALGKFEVDRVTDCPDDKREALLTELKTALESCE